MAETARRAAGLSCEGGAPMSRLVPLAIAVALGAAPLVLAQQPGGGFFPAKPDPALSRTLPPEDYPDTRPAPAAQPAPVMSATTPPQPVTTTIVTARGPTASNVEEQMDRSEAEARRAQEAAARAPQPINGAFTGSTDERDR
jgi:hypothetical protein